jgi:hypothetical protein
MTGAPPEALGTPESWYDEDAGPVVRPYAVTRGRARPRGEFDLISIVAATGPPAAAAVAGLGPEHQAIVALCRLPSSVAEIAAQLDLPVGIVRVLLGDLADRRLITVRTPLPDTQLPSEQVFEAVLRGLRAL